MVILHDAIKTIQNGVCVFFKRNKNMFLLKKNRKTRIKKMQVGFKNTGFSQP